MTTPVSKSPGCHRPSPPAPASRIPRTSSAAQRPARRSATPRGPPAQRTPAGRCARGNRRRQWHGRAPPSANHGDPPAPAARRSESPPASPAAQRRAPASPSSCEAAACPRTAHSVHPYRSAGAPTPPWPDRPPAPCPASPRDRPPPSWRGLCRSAAANRCGWPSNPQSPGAPRARCGGLTNPGTSVTGGYAPEDSTSIPDHGP